MPAVSIEDVASKPNQSLGERFQIAVEQPTELSQSEMKKPAHPHCRFFVKYQDCLLKYSFNAESIAKAKAKLMKAVWQHAVGIVRLDYSKVHDPEYNVFRDWVPGVVLVVNPHFRGPAK